jgi:serine/threonine-protein kinase
MALDVKDRYPSATEMLQDMEEFRKNPAIQFGYVYRTPMDDATRPITVMHAPAPRTTAEKVAQSKGGQSRPARQSTGNMNRNSGNMNRGTGNMNRGTGSMNATGNMNRGTGNMNATGNMNRSRDAEMARRAQQRRREEEAQRREEERNRIATVAVVVCSAVAVVAIIVFLVALFNGALLNQEKEYAIVPDLVGKEYHEDFGTMYSDFKIVLRPQEYSTKYDKGQIINQEPVEGSKVFKGTELYITISMGKEPEVKVMENLIGVPIENAQSFMDGQKLKTLIHMEASEQFAEGLVIRTDPAAGIELEEDQTIHIYVSAGPETVEMPQVVGMDKNTALGRLNSIRLVNVVTMDVESDKPKGQVVGQSVPKGEKIGLSTEIVLEISEGPVETTEAPTEESTEPETTVPKETGPVENSVKVTFILPQREEAYQLNIMLDENDVVEPQIIQPGVTSITLEFTGTGTEVYELYIDGVHYRSEKVIFTND